MFDSDLIFLLILSSCPFHFSHDIIVVKFFKYLQVNFLASFLYLVFFFLISYCIIIRLPIQSASSLVLNGGIGKNGKGKNGTSPNNKVLRDSITQAYLYSCSSLTRLLSRSPEWANISEKEREKLGLTFNDDGEFW